MTPRPAIVVLVDLPRPERCCARCLGRLFARGERRTSAVNVPRQCSQGATSGARTDVSMPGGAA